MVRHIVLHLDESFFNKIKADKQRRENKMGKISWEDYIKLLFGFAKKHGN